MKQLRKIALSRIPFQMMLYGIIGILIIVLSGCATSGDSGSSALTSFTDPTAVTGPQITSVTNLNNPGQALRQGDWCQVDGKGFGQSSTGTISNGYVHFILQDGRKGKADVHHNWTDTQIICRVPLKMKDINSSKESSGALTVMVVPPDAGSAASNAHVVPQNPTPNPSVQPTPPGSTPIRGTLTYSNLAKTFSISEMQDIIKKNSSVPNVLSWTDSQIGALQYSVDAYQIKYWSINYNKQPILVSGAVLIPKGVSAPMPLQVYQHATILSNNDAPSYVTKSTETKNLAATAATHGYIVAMTDYVGDGLCASSDVHDEYLCAASEAYNGVDALIAAKQLLSQLNLSTNGKLFLAGYSEGGQSVAALAYLLQTEYPQYPVSAAAFMEGPYSMTSELNYLLTPPGVDLEAYDMKLHVGSIICGKAVYAYNNIYNWANSMSDIFISPYDKQVTKDFETSTAPIIDLVFDFEQNTSAMFIPSFLTQATTPGTQVYNDLAANDTYNWVPKMNILFVSSKADTLIPWSGQEPYYTIMQQAAPNYVTMQFTPFPLNHIPNFYPAIVTAQVYFKKYQ